jgi:CRISPR/Cas system-associated endoribonuclease Cas2
MGKQERESRERTRRNQLRALLLGTIQAAGAISIALVAPNVIGAMAKMGMLPSPRQRDVVNRSVRGLLSAGLIRWQDEKLHITPKGERQLALLMMREAMQQQPRRWDGKWRVLVFDIPERRRALRLRVRSLFVEAGFVRLQDSVWVYPYDCEDIITLLKAEYRIGDDMRYMIVDSIERDSALRRHFKLPEA